MDSTQVFHSIDSGLQLLDSGLFESGTRIPDSTIVSGIRDSLTCIPDSTSKNFPDSGIWIPLHCTWGEIYRAKCKRNIFYSLSSPFPFPFSVVGLHVTSRRLSWWSRTKAFLSSGKHNSIFMNILQEKILLYRPPT